MVIDTSALVALLLGEDDAQKVGVAMTNADTLEISAATWVELTAVLTQKLTPADARRAVRSLERAGVEIVPFDAQQAAVAADAYRTYGRGSGSPAKLNLGDTFSYALAVTRDAPLLFVGADFTHTDVSAAQG